jgi:ribosomal protein S18 acetylase RimI-like enzyme
MKISIATTENLEAVSVLFRKYLGFYQNERSLEECLAFLGQRLRSQESVILMASDEGGRLTGFTQLYPTWSSLEMKRSYILNDLYVEIENRRQGVAQALLQAACDYTHKQEAAGLSLQTAVENKAAQALYERMGWKLDREFLTYHFHHESP